MRRALLAVAVAVVLTTATACSSSDGNGAAEAPDSRTTTALTAPAAAVEVVLDDYMVMPHDLRAVAGTVTFAVRNEGEAPHNFYVRNGEGDVLGDTKDLDPGERAEMTIEMVAGTYEVYCELPGHESLGMKSKLTVV